MINKEDVVMVAMQTGELVVVMAEATGVELLMLQLQQVLMDQ